MLLLGICMHNTHVGYGSATWQNEWASAMLALCDVHFAGAVTKTIELPGCGLMAATVHRSARLPANHVAPQELR